MTEPSFSSSSAKRRSELLSSQPSVKRPITSTTPAPPTLVYISLPSSLTSTSSARPALLPRSPTLQGMLLSSRTHFGLELVQGQEYELKIPHGVLLGSDITPIAWESLVFPELAWDEGVRMERYELVLRSSKSVVGGGGGGGEGIAKVSKREDHRYSTRFTGLNFPSLLLRSSSTTPLSTLIAHYCLKNGYQEKELVFTHGNHIVGEMKLIKFAFGGEKVKGEKKVGEVGKEGVVVDVNVRLLATG